MADITFYTFDSLKDEMDQFLKSYELIDFVIPPDKAMRKLKPRLQRQCRYCGKNGKDTKFRMEAHLIPRLLGNRYLISDFECDTCNGRFSTYESNLTQMLGLTKIVFGLSDEKEKSSYTSKGKSLRADTLGLPDQQKGVLLSDEDGTNIFHDMETAQTLVDYTKGAYIPLYVYRALLKTALGLVPKEEVRKYRYAFDFLFQDNPPQEHLSVCKVHFDEIHRDYTVHCYLFKRISDTERLPSHIFKLYYRNMIFQFFIPFYLSDIPLIYDGQPCTPIWCPPIFFQPASERETYRRYIRDLSSTEKIIEKGYLKFDFVKESMNELTAYDPKTGTSNSTDGSSMGKIRKMLLVKGNPSFDPATISSLIKELTADREKKK